MKYIKVPLTEEQLVAYDAVSIPEVLMKVGVGWLAGSSALSLYLGDKVTDCRDHDHFITYTGSLEELRKEFRGSLFKYKKRKYAINITLEGVEKVHQIIPVPQRNLEEVLDTFDLSLCSIGIERDNNGAYFLMHKDIYRYAVGLGLSNTTNSELSPSVPLLVRFVKYADKYYKEPEVMVKDFRKDLFYISSELVNYYIKDKRKFLAEVRDIYVTSGEGSHSRLALVMLLGKLKTAFRVTTSFPSSGTISTNPWAHAEIHGIVNPRGVTSNLFTTNDTTTYTIGGIETTPVDTAGFFRQDYGTIAGNVDRTEGINGRTEVHHTLGDTSVVRRIYANGFTDEPVEPMPVDPVERLDDFLRDL